MSKVPTRKGIFLATAALALSAGVVAAPARHEAKAAQTIVADQARVGQGQGQTGAKKPRVKVSFAKRCWWHRHAPQYHPAGWFSPRHRHCFETHVKRPGHRR